MNAFESGARKVIPAVLVYVKHGHKILMIDHRGSGRWNGLGGKLELDESPLQAARRELQEESGLELEIGAFQALGTLQFPNFKAHRAEDWWVTVFIAKMDSSPQLKECGEGTLHWVDADRVEALNLWPGDRLFLPYVLAERPFVGTLWYRDGQLAQSWIQDLNCPRKD